MNRRTLVANEFFSFMEWAAVVVVIIVLAVLLSAAIDFLI